MKGSELIKEKVDKDKEAFREAIGNCRYQIESLKRSIEKKKEALRDYEEKEKKLLGMTLKEWIKETRKEG